MVGSGSIDASSLGRRGVSEKLRQFVAEMPYERVSILDFVMEVAADTPAGSTVLDVGAGDAPYSELFAHADYRTTDWDQSVHMGGRRADVIASATELPLASSSVDLVLCTQVLEHVAEPARVLEECLRVLRTDGRIALTVPLAWQLHELPHDYYRYTPGGLEHLLGQAGFVEIDIHARTDGFTTIAQLLLNLSATMGSATDGLDERRREAQQLLAGLAQELARLAPLDVNHLLPLGYAALARRP